MTPEKEREFEKRLYKLELQQGKKNRAIKKSRDQEKEEIKKSLQKKFNQPTHQTPLTS